MTKQTNGNNQLQCALFFSCLNFWADDCSYTQMSRDVSVSESHSDSRLFAHIRTRRENPEVIQLQRYGTI